MLEDGVIKLDDLAWILPQKVVHAALAHGPVVCVLSWWLGGCSVKHVELCLLTKAYKPRCTWTFPLILTSTV